MSLSKRVGPSVDTRLRPDGFEAPLHVVDEGAGLGAVEDAVVEGQADVHHRAYGDAIAHDNRASDNELGGHDGGLRVVHQRPGEYGDRALHHPGD